MSAPTDKELAIITEREENRRAIDSINAQVRTKRQIVSQTILEQLGGNRFIAMTGAKNFINHGDALSFRIGRNCGKVNCVRITLNHLDLYDVEFLNINLKRKNSEWIKTVSEVSNIDADDLQQVFTMHTGMDTHL